MNREEATEAIVQALGKWSCWHQDNPPRDENHEWLWRVADVVCDALEIP